MSTNRCFWIRLAAIGTSMIAVVFATTNAISKTKRLNGHVVIQRGLLDGGQTHTPHTPQAARMPPPAETKSPFPKAYFLVSPEEMDKQSAALPPKISFPPLQNPHWRPSDSTISDLEQALWQFVQSDAVKHRLQELQAKDYWRQYVGFTTLDGSRQIYINAFCDKNWGQSDASLEKSLLQVDDGGSCFWQLIYDVETKQFLNFRVNGA